MKKLVFASHNRNKVQEIHQMLGNEFEFLGLHDLQYTSEIPETGSVLEENAAIKANTVFDAFSIPCFADDTGLEIEALHNEPGVYSARYAEPEPNSEKNMAKVLQKMKGIANRKARFRTVICYRTADETRYFEGIVNGHISEEKRGEKGFGYDPIFIPEGYEQSFAQMSAEEKNQISHRGRAFRKFLQFLK